MTKKLTLFHYFPDRLNLYGDRGNVLTLKRRCEWRNIELDIVEVKQAKDAPIKQADIVFIGGGSDREQSLCTDELFAIKQDFKSMVEDGVSCLTICGGYQFLGDHYITINEEKLKGLGILDFYSVSKDPRLIGNLLVKSDRFGQLVGFENHGGRTYHGYETLGKVAKGHGNNNEDGEEGLLYKHLIGTYLHGPILPKNPRVADFLIEKALDRKYGDSALPYLDDALEHQTNQHVWSMYQQQS
ncbi:glutamine amidotransferase [Priestia megaterium]|nr:glutamine amidotransferase [Priestia megaterium]